LDDLTRPLWATAFYTGLRVGEIRALRWEAVDFDAGLVRVERSWDDVAGEIEVKSDAGRRAVPMVGRLRTELVRHKLSSGRGPQDLVFGRTPVDAFVRSTIRAQALRQWKAVNDAAAAAALEAGREIAPDELLRPLTPHEARHTCASYLIGAGLNPKQVQTYIGHSDIRTTFNIYGHLMPGDEAQAVTQMDAYLTPRAEVALK
jgi:integrase